MPTGLPEAAPVRSQGTGPPFDLLQGRGEARMERDHGRVAAERIVFRWELHEALHRPSVGSLELEGVEPGGRRLRGIERRAHLRGDAGDRRHVAGFLGGETLAQQRPLGLVGRTEILPDEVADARRGERELEICSRCRRPLEPPGDPDGDRPVGGNVGIGSHPLEGRETVERGEGQLGGDLVEDQAGRRAGVGIFETVAALLEEVDEALGEGFAIAVGIAGLAHRLHRLGGGVVGRESIEQLHRQGILADAAAEADLVEDPIGGEFPQAAAFLGEVFQSGEVGDHAIELGPRLLVAFRLEEEPDDPQPLFRAGRIGLPVEDAAELVARDRSGGQAHVEQQRIFRDDPLDTRPARRDLRDPLDDVDPAGSGGQGEDPAAEFIKRRRLDDPADGRHASAVLRDPLGNLDPLELTTEGELVGFHHPAAGDECPRELVVTHQHRGAFGAPRGGLGNRVDRHAGDEGKPPLENAAIGQFDPIGQRLGPAGDSQDRKPEKQAADCLPCDPFGAPPWRAIGGDWARHRMSSLTICRDVDSRPGRRPDGKSSNLGAGAARDFSAAGTGGGTPTRADGGP